MSQKGLVCMNQLTNTKGAQELTDLVADYKEWCQNLNLVGPLKMFTSDCLNIDGGLWERLFQQELNENVVPYRGTSSNLPLLSIDDDGYEYIKTKSEMKTVAPVDLKGPGLLLECDFCWRFELKIEGRRYNRREWYIVEYVCVYGAGLWFFSVVVKG